MRKTVSVLGSTGSIGKSTLDLLAGHRDKFEVQALTAHKNVDLLADQALAHGAKLAVIGDDRLYGTLKDRLSGSRIEVAAGRQAVIAAASMPADWVMAAIVGAAGIEPTLAAIRQGRTVALANKESLVSAGDLMMEAVQACGTTLLPVDSEHNAIFQVLDSRQKDQIERIILTASGGPFLRKTREDLERVTPAEALHHPNWSMGAKISVDSATMMNKSLEIIEAHYLFNLEHEKIDVLIHPQSIIHSMVEYSDGSILSQMGAADMRTPIAYTLAWPERIETTGSRLDLTRNINLSLEQPDLNRFIALRLVREVLSGPAGGTTAFNAANEMAVEMFLAGKLKFSAIESVVSKVLQTMKFGPISTVGDVLDLDGRARLETIRVMKQAA